MYIQITSTAIAIVFTYSYLSQSHVISSKRLGVSQKALICTWVSLVLAQMEPYIILVDLLLVFKRKFFFYGSAPFRVQGALW
jgi:hypothetical protein